MTKITVKYTFEDTLGYYGKHTGNKTWNHDDDNIDENMADAIGNIANDFHKLKISVMANSRCSTDDVYQWYEGYLACLDTIKLLSVHVEGDNISPNIEDYTRVNARDAGIWMLNNIDHEILCQNRSCLSGFWRQKYGLYQEEFVDPELWTYKFLVKFQGDDWERDNDPLQDDLIYFIPNASPSEVDENELS